MCLYFERVSTTTFCLDKSILVSWNAVNSSETSQHPSSQINGTNVSLYGISIGCLYVFFSFLEYTKIQMASKFKQKTLRAIKKIIIFIACGAFDIFIVYFFPFTFVFILISFLFCMHDLSQSTLRTKSAMKQTVFCFVNMICELPDYPLIQKHSLQDILSIHSLLIELFRITLFSHIFKY